MQEDSANDLKVIQEWFETNRVRETGIVENVQKQPASPERDEMLEICKGRYKLKICFHRFKQLERAGNA